MADHSTEETDPPDDPDDDKSEDVKKLEDEVAKWKALARKHEGNAKTNADAAKRLKELEDADKSELQKAQDAAAEATRKAEAAELRAVRAEVAADKGLTAKQAARLVGTTREELEADADELLTEFGGGKTSGDEAPADKGEGDDKKGPPARQPKENLKGGPAPDEAPEPDTKKVLEQIPRL